MARKWPIPVGEWSGSTTENWWLPGKPRGRCAGCKGPKNEVVVAVGGFGAKVLGRWVRMR
jgi:hypothetical protein